MAPLSRPSHRRPTGPRRRSSALVAIAVVASLLLAGCSDDPTSDPSDVEPTETGPATDTGAPTDTGAATDRMDTEAVAAMQAIFEPLAADDPGCTIAVGRGGEVVYAEAFGAARLDPLEPMTTETIVDIGSTSKQFTANAILLLAEAGEIGLDDVLAEHLPDLPEWAEETTLRQLVQHTSGIPDYIGLLVDAGFDISGTSTDADALAALGEVDELDFDPGAGWEYSNSNYFLLAQVVLAVTGTTLTEFLDDAVFGPLGLDMVMDPTADIPGKAISYEGLGRNAVVADSGWEQLGDGAVQTTPSELVRWAAQYWAPTIGDDAINAARLDDAADFVDPTDEEIPAGRYGAGIQIFEQPGLGTVLSHDGVWAGFVTTFVVVPDQQLAVAATCTSPDSAAVLEADTDLDLIEPWLG